MGDLENQKLQLARSLGVCRSKENTRKDSTNANFIANLAEEQENLIQTTKREKAEFKDLDIEVRRLERQIGQQRRSANQSASPSSGSKGSSSSTTLKDKKELGQRIVLLENRLDGVMTSFNATLAQNTSVRKEIDHLVQERSNFNDLIAKLQKRSVTNK